MSGEQRIVIVGAGPNGSVRRHSPCAPGLEGSAARSQPIYWRRRMHERVDSPGFHHDVCSAVHPMGITSPFFQTLPLADHGLQWIHPPILMAHPFDDGTAAVLLRSTLDTANSLGVEDGRAYRRLMDPFVRRSPEVIAEALAPPLHIPRHPFLWRVSACTVCRRQRASWNVRSNRTGLALFSSGSPLIRCCLWRNHRRRLSESCWPWPDMPPDGRFLAAVRNLFRKRWLRSCAPTAAKLWSPLRSGLWNDLRMHGRSFSI